MAAVSVQSSGLDYYSSKLFLNSDPSFEQDRECYPLDHASLPFAPYTGERVWTGSEIALKQTEWITILSEQDFVDVLRALRHFQRLRIRPEFLSPETFPLPQHLHARLRNISHDCHNGRGFSVLRGLRPDAFTDEENVLVFGGISSHVAPMRGYQDLDRQWVTCHIISEDGRSEVEDQDLKPAFTNGSLAFHTDLGDILTLYAKETSDTGGQTTIVSSSTIYNELADLRPDLLQELRKPWAFFNTQDYNTERTPMILDSARDKLVFQFSRLPVTTFRNNGGNPTLPPITSKRLEAMSYVESLAQRHCLPLPKERGDIAFINNLCLMHGRNAFDLDSQGKPLASKRHLVKLMLRDPEMAWTLPSSLKWYSETVYGPNQSSGGRSEKWDLSSGRFLIPPKPGPSPPDQPPPVRPLTNG